MPFTSTFCETTSCEKEIRDGMKLIVSAGLETKWNFRKTVQSAKKEDKYSFGN